MSLLQTLYIQISEQSHQDLCCLVEIYDFVNILFMLID